MNRNFYICSLTRFSEMLLWSVIFSAVISFFAFFNVIISTPLEAMIAEAAGAVAFCVIQFFKLRECFFEVKNYRVYAFSNLLAFLLFAATGLVLLAFSESLIFPFSFGITDCLRDVLFDSKYFSFAVFNAVNCVMIFLAPLGMGWVIGEQIEEAAVIMELEEEDSDDFKYGVD